MGNYKFIISGIIFAAFIGIVSFETGYKKGSHEDLAYAAEKASSSVVNIFISNMGINRTRNAVGSGVIFSKEGHIVTNTHILTNARSVFVEFNDGEITEAVLIGADKYSDIAVLKISGFEGLNPIESAESSNIKIGDEVLAIGNPFGVGKTVTSGIISATGRDYGNPYLELLQTDAAINPGNSGGALLNEEGNLIGINSSIYSKTGTYSGIGCAIPPATAVPVASGLIRFRQASNSWLADLQHRQIPLHFNSSLVPALSIIKIDDTSDITNPLELNGVSEGDIILKINDLPATWANLTTALKLTFPGDEILLELYGKDANKEVLVKTVASN